MKDLKQALIKAVHRTVQDYNETAADKAKFSEPLVAFVDTRDPRFDYLLEREECEHPRHIYRPGYNLIVYYLPFAEDKTGDYDAFYDSMKLSMKVNQAIRDELNSMGRLYSPCSTMIDWDKNKFRYDWNNKIAAYMAGMGKFGPAGSFNADGVPGRGFGGRAGAVIFDQKFEEHPELTSDQIEDLFRNARADCCYKGEAGVHCSNEMIEACPGGAISEDGIDRKLCQDYCSEINSRVPDPELCGKCFKYSNN